MYLEEARKTEFRVFPDVETSVTTSVLILFKILWLGCHLSRYLYLGAVSAVVLLPVLVVFCVPRGSQVPVSDSDQTWQLTDVIVVCSGNQFAVTSD